MQAGMMPTMPPGTGGMSNMDLMSLAAGGMDPSMGMAMPNQCCTHGAMHCTMPGVTDPNMPMMSTLPPIDQHQMGSGAMMTGLYDTRTPHGGIKPSKVLRMNFIHTYRLEHLTLMKNLPRKQSSKRKRNFTTRKDLENLLTNSFFPLTLDFWDLLIVTARRMTCSQVQEY